jgi:signal peptidase I
MNTASPSVQYRRSPWTAAIISLIMPGLGQVYTGALARGLVWMFLCGILSVTGLLFLSFPSAYSWTLGCAAGLALVIVWLAAAVDSRRLALRCKPDYELKDYNRWHVYALLLLMGTGGLLAYSLDVRDQLIQPFRVPSAVMYPTILPNDRIIAVKNAYQTADPRRGDLVLFNSPEDRRLYYVKRVVALAGDKVEIKSGRLWINGVELPREAVGPATVNSGETTSAGEVFFENNNGAKYRIFISREQPAADFGPVTVPKYHCFVMIDNRNDTLHSRYFGPIAVTSLKGRFEYRYWPITGGAHWGTIQ